MDTEAKHCRVCGVEIPKARLEAIPDTLVCVRCSERIAGEFELKVTISHEGKFEILPKRPEVVVKRIRKQEIPIMNPLDSITFDDVGFEMHGDQDNVRKWYTGDGDIIGLEYHEQASDIGADLNSVRELRDFYRADVTSAGAGVVEIDTLKLDGCLAVRTIFKVPLKPSGMYYVGGFTLPFRDFFYVVRAQCNEVGITGVRETGVLIALMQSGEVEMDEDGRVKNWWQDPYDASATASVMRNRAEDEKYDKDFPDHPRSRLRRILGQIQKSLRIASEVKAQTVFSFTD